MSILNRFVKANPVDTTTSTNKLPFDATNAGIIVNTIRGLFGAVPPSENPYLKVAKDIGQGIARSVASAGITAGNLPTQVANTLVNKPILKTEQPLPFEDSIDMSGTKVGKAIFGDKPVKTVQKAVVDTENTISPYVGQNFSQKVSLPLVVGGMLLDLSMFGGSKGIKTYGEIPETFFKQMARTKTPQQVAKILERIGFGKIDNGIHIGPLSEKFAGAKTADEAKAVLAEYGPKVPTTSGANITQPIKTLTGTTPGASRFAGLTGEVVSQNIPKNTFTNPNVEYVKTDSLVPYAEYNRADIPKMSQNQLQLLIDDIKQNGIKEELILSYGQAGKNAILGEGNTRLMIAKQLGIDEVPVRVVRSRELTPSVLSPNANSPVPVPNPMVPDQFGYVPGEFKPSAILNKTAPVLDKTIETTAKEVAPSFETVGHRKLSKAFDTMVQNQTITPEDKVILETILEGTKDNYLERLNIMENGRIGVPGRFSVQRYRSTGEPLFSTNKLQLKKGFFAKEGLHFGIAPSKVFLHEFGHAGYYLVLDDAERAIVGEVFSSMSHENTKRLFDTYGLSQAHQSPYYAKNAKEFFAESFAQFALENKVPAEKMRPLLMRMAKIFYDGLKKLVMRGQQAAIEKLRPIYEKILKGDRTTPLSEFADAEPPSFKQELQAMMKETPEQVATKAVAPARPKVKPIPRPEPTPVPEVPTEQTSLFSQPTEPSMPPEKLATPGEVLEQQRQAAIEENPFGNGVDYFEPLDNIIKSKVTDVNHRVHIFDYLATPEYVLEKVGLGQIGKDVKRAYTDYLIELPKNINKITEWSKRVPRESNPRIFKWLDGDKTINLNPAELKVATEVKAWLGDWAERLGLDPDKRIMEYITHIFPPGKGGELNEEIAKMIQHVIPGSVYDPYLLQRTGVKGYIEDTWRALDAYVKTATRKVYMDPVLDELKTAASPMEKSVVNYVKRFGDRVNMRPTEMDEMIDTWIKSVVGYRLGVRPVRNITSMARKISSRAKLGLSFTSAFKNLTQGVNTFAELGAYRTLTGYLSLFKPGAMKELEQEGVLMESFIEDRTYNAVKQFWERADKVTFYNFTLTERINRGAAYFGAKGQALARGATEQEARKIGKAISDKTQFVFGSTDTPVFLGSDIMKTAAQFQTFTLKQTEFLIRKAKHKEYASLARYVAASALVFGVIGKAFGMKFSDIVPSFRFGTPPAFDFPVRVGKAILGTKDQYGNVPSGDARLRDVGNAFMQDIVPGGTQLKRTFQGLGAVSEGKSTTAAGNFQYKIGQTPENYIRGALFGKTNLPEANEFYKKKDEKAKAKGKTKSNTSLSDRFQKL